MQSAKRVSDAEHPIWGIIRSVATTLSVGFVLWLNASNFDRTELKSIAEIAVILAIGEPALAKFREKMKKSDDEE